MQHWHYVVAEEIAFFFVFKLCASKKLYKLKLNIVLHSDSTGLVTGIYFVNHPWETLRRCRNRTHWPSPSEGEDKWGQKRGGNGWWQEEHQRSLCSFMLEREPRNSSSESEPSPQTIPVIDYCCDLLPSYITLRW